MSAWRFVDGEWRHRPWWKVAINAVLRLFQPRPRKWVVYSYCDERTAPPTVLRYGFGKILHR